ncbi:hypothetical protein FPZ12_014520 [Amycolatopsis acidicola]|uniref:Uncharacterized protein n=2 Tax=Amycolatopsis acidicola TaxID=2596893 RepID=A0A5N0V4K8_9PSEU|nr:hypothetical protein FPZ12_014520 [Amycolatopsis acidicola]
MGYPAHPQPGTGYPAQGFPGQGYPQGSPGVGSPGQGYPTQGSPGTGYPPPGSPAQGYPPQGSLGQGYPPPDSPAQGYPPPDSLAQGYPQGSPAHGSPQGFPAQGSPGQGYPAPGAPGLGYPAPGYAAQGYPGQGMPFKPGPLTLPGLGAIPAVAGIVLILVGLFALPWLTLMGQTDYFTDITQLAADSTGSGGWSSTYAIFLGYLVVFVQLVNPLPWTLGALRGKKSAFLLSGIRRKDLTRENLWWYRTVFGSRATLMLGIHVAGVIGLFHKDLSLIGAGAWLVLVGSVLVAAGAFVGPRVTAHMPPG